jgi:dTDP-4-dehydrorhamnose reductase
MSQIKTVLVVGGSGFVGTHVAKRLREQFKVFATYRSHPTTMPGVTYRPLAVENRAHAKKLLRSIEPHVIIYCVGPYDAAWAEAHPEEADNVYSSGASVLAEASGILQSKFIYLSNSYTFDGKRGNYHEADVALPHHSFGKLKLAGENYVRNKTLNWISVRSSPLIGRGVPFHPSFIDQIRMKLDRGVGLELSDQETHSFASVEGLTEMLATLCDSTQKNKIFHYGGLTKLSHYEFGKLFARAFGFPENLVTRPQSPETKRDRDFSDYSLNCTAAVEALKINPFLLEQSFDLLKKQMIPGTRLL